MYKKKYVDEGLIYLDTYNRLHEMIMNGNEGMNQEIWGNGLNYLFEQRDINGKVGLKLPSYQTFKERLLESEQ